jgi:hypothetical protein
VPRLSLRSQAEVQTRPLAAVSGGDEAADADGEEAEGFVINARTERRGRPGASALLGHMVKRLIVFITKFESPFRLSRPRWHVTN